MVSPTGQRLSTRASTARIVLVTGLLLVAVACSGNDSASANRTGNARVNEPPVTKPSTRQRGPQAVEQPAAEHEGLLSTTELGLVYQFVLSRYVDAVDHRQLIEAAVAGIHEAGLKAHALPIDLALTDLTPLPGGDAEEDWSAFASGFDAFVQKHPVWAMEARPDWAVLRKMLDSLNDDHTSFMEPADVRRMGETNFTGVGIRMTRPQPDQPPHVVEVFPNSPAAGSGVRPGDQIMAVDGKPTASRTLTDIIGSIRGAQGTRVILSIVRSQQPPVEIQMTRAPVDAPRVEGSVRGGVLGVLRIRSFGDGVPEQVQQVLTQGRNRGARAWILDLRGNPGGSLEAMARVAPNFIESRPVGLAVGREGQPEQIVAPGRNVVPRFPFVVLVDHETSSAAELLAAAVKEYQIAPLVGVRTAGSAGLAAPQPLSDGSAIQVTIRRLTTPGGAAIDKQGVQPDVTADLTLADLQRVDDPQMMRAIELLAGGPIQLVR